MILNVNTKRFQVRGLTIPFDKWLKINKITEGKEVIEENVNVINQLNESNTVTKKVPSVSGLKVSFKLTTSPVFKP